MPTLKFTIVGRYEAPDNGYDGVTDPQTMSEMDQEDIDNGVVGLADLIEWVPSDRDITVRIEPE